MRVELYGVLSEVAGTDQLEIEPPEDGSAAGALARVAEACPELAPHLERVAVAVGDRVVPPGAALGPAEEIVLLPPVSGGGPTCGTARG